MAAYTASLPSQAAAGAATVTPLGVLQVSNDTEVYPTVAWLLLPMGAATLTGVATNNVTVNVRQVRAGAATTFASVTFGAGTNLVAGTPLAVPLTANVGPWQPGDGVDVQCVQNGTGLAFPAGVLAEAAFA